MKDSLASYIKAVSPDIPADLISTENLDRLCSLTQHFPTIIASAFGFESSLTDPEPIADFFFCTEANQGGRDWLAGESALTQLPTLFKIIGGYDEIEEMSPLILEQPTWQKIRNFCLDWANPKSDLHQVDNIWLEFDFAQTRETIPIPSLFFSAEHFNSETDYSWWAKNILSGLKDTSISSQTTAIFINCLTILPPNIKPFQIGILLPREQQLRIYIPFVSYQQLLNYLTQINWQGNLSLWEYLLSQFSRLVDNFQLQIEIRDHLCPEIAIELYPQNQNSWDKILNYLTEIGFCLPEKKEALLSYSGLSDLSSSSATINLSKMAKFFAPDNQVVFRRNLGYLKMSYQPENPIAFKAYLLVTPAWQKG